MAIHLDSTTEVEIKWMGLLTKAYHTFYRYNRRIRKDEPYKRAVSYKVQWQNWNLPYRTFIEKLKKQVAHTFPDLVDRWAEIGAIAADSTAPKISTGFAAGATYTWTHTCTGSNLMLWLHAGLWQDVAGTGTVGSSSYNSAAVTSYVTKNVTGGAMRAELWRKLGPSTGANTMSVTVSGNTDDRKFGSSSFTGVDQTTGVDNFNSAEGGASPITVNVTTIADNCWIVDAVANFSTAALTIGAGQTQVFKDSTGSTGMAGSYEGPKTPAGAVTMSWTKTGTDDWAQVAASFKPASTLPPLTWQRPTEKPVVEPIGVVSY